jgi:two-component system, cell cycle sensor histidine kinase DivJ
VRLFEPVRDDIDALGHSTAQQDALTCARHRAFIAPRLLAGLVVVAAFALYGVVWGHLSAWEALPFAWLLVIILIAFVLSRVGRYEDAHVLSSLALAGLVLVVAATSGGMTSFATVWLVAVPLEATVSLSRRVVLVAAAMALSVAGLLWLAGSFDLFPPLALRPQESAPLAGLGIVSALLFTAGIALVVEQLARTSALLHRAEEDRYRLLAQNMTDVITRHDRNGAVLFVSPTAEQMLGANAENLHGQGLFDRVHVTDRPGYLKALADAAADGGSRSVEFRARRDGAAEAADFIWIEMRCRALEHSKGQRATEREVVAVMRDITQRKQEAEAVEFARTEAERANAAKSRFLATMSHELRTPLNAVIGFSEMLCKESTLMIDAARRHEYAELINESGRHLLSVVNGILDMSKIETGNFAITPEPFSPRQAIEDCCGLLALKARESGIELTTVLAGELPDIVADKRALNQIMLNLVSNAIKFTDRGGRITVSARHEGNTFVVTVADTGVGIDSEDMARIGDPFFQARSSYDRRHDGTGLGLSIVKGLVALHGGDMEIASRIGEGTSITIRLPVDCESARRSAEMASIGQGAARAAALVVEPATERPTNERPTDKLVKIRA